MCSEIRNVLTKTRSWYIQYTVPKVIDFPRYNMKCSGENVTLRGIFQVVSWFPLHFVLYRGNLDYFSDSVHQWTMRAKTPDKVQSVRFNLHVHPCGLCSIAFLVRLSLKKKRIFIKKTSTLLKNNIELKRAYRAAVSRVVVICSQFCSCSRSFLASSCCRLTSAWLYSSSTYRTKGRGRLRSQRS